MKPSAPVKKFVARILSFSGYELRKVRPNSVFPSDLDQCDISDVQAVRPFTLTTPERIVSLTWAIKYIVSNGISGDLVECGVWRGGSIMAAARALLRGGDT